MKTIRMGKTRPLGGFSRKHPATSLALILGSLLFFFLTDVVHIFSYTVSPAVLVIGLFASLGILLVVFSRRKRR